MAPSSGRGFRGRGQPFNRGRRNPDDRHGHENTQAGRGRGANSQPVGATSVNQKAFITWRNNIPRKPKKGPFSHIYLTSSRLASFMQEALRLIELRNDGIRQEVITNLASEGGLKRVLEVVEMIDQSLQPKAQCDIVERTVLPFLETVTHTDVLPSLLLEEAVGNIFVFLYGVGGRRGPDFFKSFTDVLEILMIENPASKIRPAAATALAALLKVLECNQVAALNTGFEPIVDVLETCLKMEPETFQGTLAEQAATRDMLSVRRYLKFGENVEPFEIATTKQKKAAFAFEIALDGPGALSRAGRRHNNDHETISDIKILPTAEEIRSPRSEYLPPKDSTSWHIPGIRGLIDQQFRLLREDTVGQLRDCIHQAMEFSSRMKSDGSQSSREKPQNSQLKVFTYSKVQLSDAVFENEKRKQMNVVASFAQPEHLYNKSVRDRETWWESSKRLQPDSLVSLVDEEGNTQFFTVSDRGGIVTNNSRALPPKQNVNANDEKSKSSRAVKLWSDPRTALVTLRIIDMRNPALAAVLGRDWKSKNSHQILVEFPGILLPSFEPTLRALQRMNQTQAIPFSQLLLPSSETNNHHLTWPAYATQPGFAFDLGVLTLEAGHLFLSPNQPVDYAVLKSQTTLDDAQCKALVGALSRNLALVQGPPGTGKSYVAVQAVKVLLECRQKAKLNPIICVCYTNHALDQFLEQMLEDDVQKVIRIGGQSKSARLDFINLRVIAQTIEPTRAEKHALWERKTSLEEEGFEIQDLLKRLRRSGDPHILEDYLKTEEIEKYDQIFGLDDDGFQTVARKGSNPIQRWLNGGPKTTAAGFENTNRDLSDLINANPWKMNRVERKKLCDHWIHTLRNSLSAQLRAAIEGFLAADEFLAKCKQEIKLRCLEKAQIIGITTSGLAQNVELLRRLRPKVLICEEAGEILEAHTLTAFLPSIEHAILIGDHEQLRPQVQNYSLSLESQHGKKYALDMSTFERLIKMELPFDTLETQRRMHPLISDLIRQTIYPHLRDHQFVLEYPQISGFRSRLYWLDHQKPEVESDSAKILETSHSNDYEVDIVESMVLHLVRQGIYGAGDLVVLTPYVRQLQKLRQRLASSFEIIIGDRDQSELDKHDTGNDPNKICATHRAMLTEQLRISTVDNFQGEEAQVVLVSLVRSNSDHKCGFLRTSNRINVLLSRAKHGMYIIGNTQTYDHIPMWKKVMEILRANGNMGFSIPLCCPKHPGTLIEATSPEDFHMRAPEGGCDLPCDLRLDCGHSCTFKCHSKQRHDVVICQEPCPRFHPKCGHSCPKNCGADCGRCLTMVPNITLPCGHVLKELECYKTDNLQSVKCPEILERIVSDCKHVVRVQCHENVSESNFKCCAACDAILPCGHNCRKACHRCKMNQYGDSAPHGKCNSKCGRQYSTCGHSCRADCHGDQPCPLCDQDCPIKCQHSKCSKKCHEPCAPCAEPCNVGCQHQGKCTMPCAVPCNTIPCSLRCDRILNCGHQCPSLCGEPCPDVMYCQKCAPEEIKSATVDYILGEVFKDANLDEDPVIVPPCGHLICRSSMDGIMDMSKYYDMSAEDIPHAIQSDSVPFSVDNVKVCPQCRGSLREINRFARVIKRAMLDESTKRFIVWSNSRFVPLTSQLRNEEQRLNGAEVNLIGNIPNTVKNSPDYVCIDGERNEQIRKLQKLPGLGQRLQITFKLREDISSFRDKVREDEQPFSKVCRLSRQASRMTEQATFTFDSSVLQTQHRLLTDSLLLRADLIIISDFLNVVQNASHRKLAFPWLGRPISLNLHHYRSDCLTLADDSVQKQQPMTQVESLVYFVNFIALERKLPKDETKIQELVDEGRHQLQVAREVMAKYPSTASLSEQVDAAENMLRNSTFYTVVTSEERQAIYMAMAQDFRGTGHWYYCVNMHPFTVGECGMPMQTSRCPQCGAPVGGRSHQSVEGVTRALDLDEDFGRMRL